MVWIIASGVLIVFISIMVNYRQFKLAGNTGPMQGWLAGLFLRFTGLIVVSTGIVIASKLEKGGDYQQMLFVLMGIVVTGLIADLGFSLYRTKKL